MNGFAIVGTGYAPEHNTREWVEDSKQALMRSAEIAQTHPFVFVFNAYRKGAAIGDGKDALVKWTNTELVKNEL